MAVMRRLFGLLLVACLLPLAVLAARAAQVDFGPFPYGVFLSQGPTYHLSPGWTIVRAARVTGGSAVCFYNGANGDFTLLDVDANGVIRHQGALLHMSAGWTAVEPVPVEGSSLLVIFSRPDGVMTTLLFDHVGGATCDSATDPDCHP
jgi:hypothetical protein